MVAASVSLESLCVNSIRMLAVDAVNKSNSGHPGLPMGCAPMGYALWQNILNTILIIQNGSIGMICIICWSWLYVVVLFIAFDWL